MLTHTAHPPRSRVGRTALFALLCILPGAGLSAQQVPPACVSDAAFQQLDFWVGSWDVFVQERLVGTDRVEKVLAGCAITEDWTDARGVRGHSLFYVEPASRTWRQVWVTENALARGGLKEKRLIARLPGGGVRFQGEIALEGGASYLDRTTLTPLTPDRVHQLIEVSTDGGTTWRATFDAVYRRVAGRGP